MAGNGAEPSFGSADDVWWVAWLVIRPAGDADVPLNGAIPRGLFYCAAAAVLVSRKAGITSFANRSRFSS
jgi:hypothetical protein